MGGVSVAGLVSQSREFPCAIIKLFLGKGMSKFDLKDKLDRGLYSVYNRISELAFSIDAESKKLVGKNSKYKKIHKGRCFILGTGPSLKSLTADQLSCLKSEILFGVNSLYKSAVTSDLIPRYYTLIDNLYWESEEWGRSFNEVREKYSDAPPVFITDPRAKKIMDALSSNCETIYIYSKKYPVDRMSAEITTNIYAAMNCISYSILVAMYMGFSQIYLLGCDYNAFCSAGSGHCYDDKDELKNNSYNLAFYLKFYWITTEFHYLISKLAKETGVEVVNLTPNSLLDAYPRRAIGDVI